MAGAIRRRGGPKIQEECDAHRPIAVGEAAITGGGDLHAHHVIHAASMQLGGRTISESLTSSMNHAFRLAHEHGVRTIAIPAVGTGIAGFPIDACARVMAAAVRKALARGWGGTRKKCVSCSSIRASNSLSNAPFGLFSGGFQAQSAELSLNWGCIRERQAPRMGKSAPERNLV